MKKTQRLSLLAPLAAVLLLAFGVQAQAGAATTSAVVKAAQKRLAADYKGDYGSPPRSGPKPAKGKKIAIVPVTLGAPSIADQANAAKQAATLVGWKTTIFDGKASVSGFNEAIRAATAARVNAIFTIGIDCAPVQSALSEAKKAGIKIVASVGSDCDAAPLKKSKLFDATVGFNFGHVFAVTGRMRADWLIANAGDHAKILQFVQGDNPVIAPQVTATETSLKKYCPACSFVRSSFVTTDLGPGLANKVQSALLQNPTVNALAFPYDAVITLGAGAIQASGKRYQVMGGECVQANLELIRAGRVQNACVGTSTTWVGYASVDAINRVFHKVKTADPGIGFQLVDKTHNLPAKGKTYQGPVNFKAIYKKTWGLR